MKPLQHLTIVDLSQALAGPFASMILAELGATVIKVEPPGAGDETRAAEPRLASGSAQFFACNRSKASITVDLRADGGRRIIRELAQQADVLVENFPVGTLARQGLDYAALSSIHPRLVYVSCTGFGQSGPYAQKQGDGPAQPGLPAADLTSGLWVAIAILAALSGREKTGRGSYVDFSMLDGQVSLLGLAAARYFALGAADVPAGPMKDVAEVLADPHVRGRKLVGSFDYPGVGEFKALALPYKFLGWDDPRIGPPPALGAHTETILKERLGYTDERIAELRLAKAI
ncbi:MAG: CoA transferase [Betaproteobacteria bacterium]|nr:CoA transferase [Betaproteobacteria bacterium]